MLWIIFTSPTLLLIRCQFHLALIKPAIKATALHQVSVLSGFNESAGIQHQNFVRIANRAQSVSDDQCRATF